MPLYITCRTVLFLTFLSRQFFYHISVYIEILPRSRNEMRGVDVLAGCLLLSEEDLKLLLMEMSRLEGAESRQKCKKKAVVKRSDGMEQPWLSSSSKKASEWGNSRTPEHCPSIMARRDGCRERIEPR